MIRGAGRALAAAALAAASAGAAVAVAAEGEGTGRLVCDRVLEDFSGTRPGEFPRGWRTRHPENEAEARARRVYAVERVDGAPALRGRYGTHTITAVRGLPRWNLAEYPVLAWRWKAVRLPDGGDEGDPDRNDSAASVYLVWNVGFPFRIADLRVAWSTTLPEGRTFSKRLGLERVIVAASGPASAGWREVRVDLLREASALLGDDAPRSPAVLALTTDADATRSGAEALYADFRLCRRADGAAAAPSRDVPRGEGG